MLINYVVRKSIGDKWHLPAIEMKRYFLDNVPALCGRTIPAFYVTKNNNEALETRICKTCQKVNK